MMDRHSLERFLTDNIYLTPTQAREEISRRRNDLQLVNKATKYLKNKIPHALKDGPKAVLARVLASPNHEFFEFQRLAEEAGMEGWCLEYTNDKFRAENFDKYYLGKLFFKHGIGKKGGEKSSVLKVIDFDQAEGKLVCSLETLWGENFVDFHHRLVRATASEASNFEDAAWWIEENGKKTSLFYPYYLAMFICHGVLFENFLVDDKQLIDELFLPALDIVYREFGLYPLVVPLSPIESEYDLHWRQYPSEVESVAIEKIKREQDIRIKISQ